MEFSLRQDRFEEILTDENGGHFLTRFIKELKKEGLLSFGGGSTILVAPPLIISREELDEAFERFDRAIRYVDALVEASGTAIDRKG